MKIIMTASRIAGHIAMAVVIVMMVLIFTEVFIRNIFNITIPGVTELTELMMTWLLLGIAWGIFEGSHVQIDLVMSRMPQRVQKITGIITLLLSLFIYFLTTWQGVKAIQYSLGHNVSTAILGMPEALSLGFFTFSFALFCVAAAAILVQKTVEVIKG